MNADISKAERTEKLMTEFFDACKEVGLSSEQAEEILDTYLETTDKGINTELYNLTHNIKMGFNDSENLLEEKKSSETITLWLKKFFSDKARTRENINRYLDIRERCRLVSESIEKSADAYQLGEKGEHLPPYYGNSGVIKIVNEIYQSNDGKRFLCKKITIKMEGHTTVNNNAINDVYCVDITELGK